MRIPSAIMRIIYSQNKPKDQLYEETLCLEA